MTNKIPTSMMVAASELNFHGDSYAPVGVYDAATCTVLGTSDGKVERGRFVFGGITFTVEPARKGFSSSWCMITAEIEPETCKECDGGHALGVPCDICGGIAEGNTCCDVFDEFERIATKVEPRITMRELVYGAA